MYLSIKSIARQLCPRLLWLYLQKIRGWLTKEEVSYQGVRTAHNMRALHHGKFSNLYNKYIQLLPTPAPNTMRLRLYLICFFANQAKFLDGDFLIAGVSHGIAPRIVYDFVDFSSLEKKFHFIDPFDGSDAHGLFKENYNTDINFVKNQYPASAQIVFHERFIPECFPLPELHQLSFVHLATGAWEAEAESVPYLYDLLVMGGIMVIDDYANFIGQQEIYNPVIELCKAQIFTMITGQGVIVKTSNIQ
jgi:hypothetical protein